MSEAKEQLDPKKVLAEQKAWLVQRGDAIGELAREKGDWKNQIQGMAEAARRETEPLVLLNLLRYQATRNKNWKQGTDVFSPLEADMKACIEKANQDPELAVLLIQHLLAYTYRAYTYHYEMHKAKKPAGREAS
jgi:hypothetical protein